MCELCARPICLYGVFHVCHGPICPDRRHVRVPTLVPKCLSWYYKRAESTLALSHPLTTNRCSSTPLQTCVHSLTLSLPFTARCMSVCLYSTHLSSLTYHVRMLLARPVCVCVGVCVRACARLGPYLVYALHRLTVLPLFVQIPLVLDLHTHTRIHRPQHTAHYSHMAWHTRLK